MSSRRDPRNRSTAASSSASSGSNASAVSKRRRNSQDDRDDYERDRDRDRRQVHNPKDSQSVSKERVLFAVICASNMNRSMEGHHVLALNGFKIESYGTGSAVRLPGPSIDRPNVYPFGTEYEVIHRDLVSKDRAYTQNGLLTMLERNIKTKRAPESWQDCRKIFNVIFTCEERCYDAVLEELMDRGEKLSIPVHVINLEIRDNAEDAHVGGKLFIELATLIEHSKDHEHEMTQILEDFQVRTKANILHSICYF
ncbi:Ssu72-domain-containing protein [Chytriomyces cf. hyalinus JEL632]|nr:Ssu72-domain-containing protein [Chytriomyces cf. hyalinus JEL632]